MTEPAPCSVCGEVTTFRIAPGCSERAATCPCCHAARRTRDLAAAILQTHAPASASLSAGRTALADLSIFEAQATGPIHDLLAELPGYVCSEFYDDVQPGQLATNDVRCEDLQALTFADRSFDVVITQDVLEH